MTVRFPFKVQTFFRDMFSDFYVNAWRERSVIRIGPVQILRRAK